MSAELVTNPSRLEELSTSWAGAADLAVDTEFVFERTYYPRLGLIQIASPEGIWLVDPLGCGDLAPLARALSGRGWKVLHSAGGDLAVLGRALSTLPRPILDTQVAAALAGLGVGISYQRLVEALLGKLLAKGATRSDWLARPLSAEQLAYAAEDVVDLLEVAARLRERLEALGRWAWALADSERLLAAATPPDPESAPSRLRGLERLPPAERAAAQALAVWREREAIRRDLPRRWVLDDAALLALARRRPATPAELEEVPGLEARQARREAEAWLAVLAAAATEAPDSRPPARGRPSPRERHLADRLHRLLRRRAEELALPPEVLAPRRVLDAIAAQAIEGRLSLPAELTGWREEVIGRDLLAASRSDSS